MKSITEFWKPALAKGQKAKADLIAAGKTPEEILTGLGETFKLEGDKLKHFFNAIDVAIAHPEKLQRVLVVSLSEGEKAPQKATQVEEHYYVPEFVKEIKPPEEKETKNSKGGRGGKGNKQDRGPKPSPWGLSPEEIAAKKAGSKKNQPAKKE